MRGSLHILPATAPGYVAEGADLRPRPFPARWMAAIRSAASTYNDGIRNSVTSDEASNPPPIEWGPFADLELAEVANGFALRTYRVAGRFENVAVTRASKDAGRQDP